MIRFYLALAVLAFSFTSAEALGRSVARNVNPMQQSFEADAIVVGNVVEVEKDVIETTQYPGVAQKSPFTIVNVKVSETLTGITGLTHIRIGYVSNGNGAYYGDDVQIGNFRQIRGGRAYQLGNANIDSQAEGCFFLKKHHEGDFYVMVGYGGILDKKNEQFEDELKKIKKILSVIEKPMEALKAKEAAERQFAACALLMKYRTQPQAMANQALKQENVPAEQTKLIFENLATMDWGAFDANGMSLQNVWYYINPQPQNGFTAPQNDGINDFNAVMTSATQKWLKANADKFALQRFVLEKVQK